MSKEEQLDNLLVKLWNDIVKLNKEQIKGQIKGLNTARIRVWGIGYDNDETALEIRQFLCEQINKLQEMLDIDDENEE